MANVSQTTDGRGLPRSVDLPGITGDTPVDLGAYELQTGVQELPSLLVTTDSDVVDAFDFATSLREAVAFANDTTAGSQNDGDADEDGFVHDTITFSESLRGKTITLGAGNASGQLTVAASVTFAGLGADQLAISGNNNSRIFNFFSNDDAIFTVSDLTLTNGVVPRGDQPNPGAGGAIILGSSNDTLVIERSVITDSASNGGGAIFFAGNGSELEIVDSSLINNEANFSGSAVLTFGNTKTTIVNSTISGNRSLNGSAAVFQQTFGSDVGVMEIRNSTFAGNTGRAVANNINTASTIEFSNTIFADNTLGSISGGGAITSLGNNLSDVSSNFLNGPDDQIADPMLLPLALNGGTTLTHALSSSSLAIDGGSNQLAVDAENNVLTSDQTGRRRIFDNLVDIGAVEFIADDSFLLGDVNNDGAVNFLDISPFISLLASGDFLGQADTNGDGTVNFLDIGPFISLLSSGGSSLVSSPSKAAATSSGSDAKSSGSAATSKAFVAEPDVAFEAPLVSVAKPKTHGPLVVVDHSLASSVVAKSELAESEPKVASATPIDTFIGPVAVATDRYRFLGDRISSSRGFEGDGPLVKRSSLTGFAERVDFSNDSRDHQLSGEASTEPTFATAAELFDAHPESLDEVFDIEFDDALAGLV